MASIEKQVNKQAHRAIWYAGWVLCATLGAGAVAMAAGLGQLATKSQLGEPLVAEIGLVIQDRRELNSLVARIAPADAHRSAGIPYQVASLGLKASIQTGKDGRSFIRVETLRPVSDPSMRLLVELSGPGSNTLREYTVLLEPPEVQRR